MNETDLKGDVVTDGAKLSVFYSKAQVDKKFDQMTAVLLTVVVILLVMVATLVIDSFHFNSATYKEYSGKTVLVETTQKINQEMLNQIKENQQMIIDLQNQLLQKK